MHQLKRSEGVNIMRKKCKKLTRKVLSLLLAGSMVLPSVYVGKGAGAG